jgi:MFS family permease
MSVFALSGTGTSLWLLGIVSLLYGIGQGFVGAPTMSSVYRAVEPALASRATSALFILVQIAAAIGVAIFALIVQRTDISSDGFRGFERAFWVGVAGMILMMVASQLLPGKPSAMESEPSQPADGFELSTSRAD